MPNDPPQHSSVDRALLVLRLLRDRGRLRVQDVAEELSVAPSTAHRLLSALQRSGFAVQGPERSYLPGPELQPTSLRSEVELVDLARPHLRALSVAVGETTHLMVLQGASARFLDGVEGERVVRVARRVSLVLPAHVTSGGKALLAELDHAALSALYPGRLPLTPDARGPDLATLRRELTTVRRRGYAVNAELSEQGVNAVGTCVRTAGGVAVAAVVIAAPSARVPAKGLSAMVPRLLAAARDIGAALR